MSRTIRTSAATAKEVPTGPIKRADERSADPVHSPGPTLLPSSSQHRPNGQLPNTPLAVSVISASLGGLVCASLAFCSVPYLQKLGSGDWAWARPQFALYAAAMGMFHLWEFWTTAGWNPNKLSVDAFLLNNGLHYHIAHLAGIVEYLVSSYYWPSKFTSFWNTSFYILPVLALLITGQTLRSLAMIHASRSFSHIVKVVKHDDHVLITDGVYRFFRHPSYVGFFYWALATQLLLGNVASTVAFALVLGRFFHDRIIDEERHLVRFFGQDYIDYRKRVGTGLPFPTSS